MRGLLRTDVLSVYSFCMVPKQKAVLTDFFPSKLYFSHVFYKQKVILTAACKKGFKYFSFWCFSSNYTQHILAGVIKNRSFTTFSAKR